MRRIVLVAAVSGLFALPALAQEDMSCTDYTAMDSTGQMAAMEHAEEMAGETGAETNSTEEMMAMAAEACGAHPDMMVGEAMEMMSQ